MAPRNAFFRSLCQGVWEAKKEKRLRLYLDLEATGNELLLDGHDRSKKLCGGVVKQLTEMHGAFHFQHLNLSRIYYKSAT